MKVRERAWTAAAALALAGCAGGTEPAGGRFEVRVVNGGAAELRAVAVHVSRTDSVVAGVLAPGAATAWTRASAVHESPAVRATVAGQPRALIPVEGFDAFNPTRAPGRYTVTLAAGARDHELVLTVRRE